MPRSEAAARRRLLPSTYPYVLAVFLLVLTQRRPCPRPQLPFLPAFAGILLHMGIVWVASYTVAPTITHLEQQRSAAAGTGGPAVSSSFAFGSALDCGNPRIAALVSCRPVWQQCVVAAFLVAFPAVFAAASQGWLWGRFRKAPAGQQLQRQEQQLRGAQQQLHTLGPHSAQVPQQPLGPMGDAGWPAAAGGTDPAPLGDPMYQSRVRSRTVSIKVRWLGAEVQSHNAVFWRA